MINFERRAIRVEIAKQALLWTVMAIPALTAAQFGYAQTGSTNSTAAEPANGVSLDEVVVTARRRSESADRVPISITAFDSQQLREHQIHTEADLQSAVPGLSVETSAVSTEFNFSLRGQSVDTFTGSSPAVLVYVNDVEANAGGPSSLFDLSSIQVLKGPQGTLFGRNTTGGAVLYTTTAPDDKLSGYVTERFGNFDLTETIGAINLPVSDRAEFRLAGDVYHRGGYQRDVATAQTFGSVDRQTGRVTALLTPVEGLKNQTVAEFGNAHGHPVINELWSYNKCGTPGLTSTVDCYYSPLLNSITGDPTAWAQYLAAHPGAPASFAAALALQKQLGPWGVYSPQSNDYWQQYWSITNTTTYDITSEVQFKNIAGVTRSDSTYVADEIGVPYAIQLNNNPAIPGDPHGDQTKIRGQSDEMQILGKALNDALDYVTGLYFSYNQHTEHDYLAYFGAEPIIPATGTSYFYVTSSHSEAVYGQGTYDLSSMTGVSGLKLTGGLRYTWETDGVFYPSSPYAALSGQPPESKLFDSPSWQVGLDYQMTPEWLLYIVQRGSWRSGGFNGYAPSKPTTSQFGGNEYLPEKTHDIELGSKFRGDLDGMPSLVTVALFNQWITDIQRIEFSFANGSPAALTANIPAGQVRGVEVSAEISPTSLLKVGVSGAYNDAFFTNGVATAYNGSVLNYGPFGSVSRFTGDVYAQVALPTPSDWGGMSVRSDVYGQTYQYFSNLDSTVIPGTRMPGYGLVNLRADWTKVFGSNLTISAFAKNLANRGYYTGGIPFGFDFGLNSVTPGEPRTYGGELHYEF
jgi:iron complex outermembrane recepter protein